MKKRTNFVSNSSSSSFIVDSKEHGKWFRQLISIMKNIQDDTIYYCTIYFDINKIKIDDLFKIFRDVEGKFNIESNKEGDKDNHYLCLTITQSYTLNYLTSNLIDNITRICCNFHDSCDIGEYADHVYKILKDTGMPFTWNGK